MTARAAARHRLTVAAAGVALAAAVAWLLWIALRPAHPALLSAVEARATLSADGIPEIALASSGGEYRPNVIHAPAGKPLRLRVSRSDAHGCSAELLVPDLNASFDLADRREATLLLPAAARGSYLFTCGARMVKGVILFE